MFVRVVVVALACLGLAGCGDGPPKESAQTAKRLLSAAWADDLPRFAAEIDRDAVRENLRRQILEAARSEQIEVDGGPANVVLERMIGPQAVRNVVSEQSARVSAEDLRGQMKVVPGGACLPDSTGACLLTFANRKGRWRLVGVRVAVPGLDAGPGGLSPESFAGPEE